MDLRDINFDILPDAEQYRVTAEAIEDAARAVRDMGKQMERTRRRIVQTEKQLLKFDEINRLVAYETVEATTGSGRSGSTKTTSKSTAKTGTKTTTSARAGVPEKMPSSEIPEAALPMYLAVKDVLFSWEDLNWEQIMMKIIAGLSALGGAVIGGMVGGVPGAVIGLTAGLLFGILADSAVFNFDGKLSEEEFRRSLLMALPVIAGGLIGVIAGGPLGAAVGITLGAVVSMKLADWDLDDFNRRLGAWFGDLFTHFDVRWESLRRLMREKWDGLRAWWQGLSLPSFSFRLPHITVSWQELGENSAIRRFLGLTALPHLGVEWYAKGGIVDGATLIGAGEKGKEAIIPLERHTEWIHLVALELKKELEVLIPPPEPLTIPAGLVPYGATVQRENAGFDLDGLARTIAGAIAELGNRNEEAPEIRVYLDGKQLSDAVTRYQRREQRAYGR